MDGVLVYRLCFQYTEPHGRPKQLYVHPLQRNARKRTG